jgi:Fe-S cluster assembly ATP-binding protein
MLEIKNLSVEVEDKKIIENLSLEISPGKAYALMGPNGSGKSTLANVLMGNPKYKIVSGQIFLNKKDITKLKTNERSKLGLFMSFQMPQEIEGVRIFDFLRTSYNALNEKISLLKFQKILKEKCEILGLEESFTERYLNKGFSGGEKKKSEILQMLVLNPKIIILDETDSGLDIDALKTISKAINYFKQNNKDKTILIITHYKRIFEHMDVDEVFIISKGKLKFKGGKEIIDKLEKEGYGVLDK